MMKATMVALAIDHPVRPAARGGGAVGSGCYFSDV